MFGRGFVTFISWSTVSAYLARAWHPLRRDEVFSFGKCFLRNQIFVQQLFFQPIRRDDHIQRNEKKDNGFFFFLCVSLFLRAINDRNLLFVLTDHRVFKPWASNNVHLYRLNTRQDLQQSANQIRHFMDKKSSIFKMMWWISKKYWINFISHKSCIVGLLLTISSVIFLISLIRDSSFIEYMMTLHLTHLCPLFIS